MEQTGYFILYNKAHGGYVVRTGDDASYDWLTDDPTAAAKYKDNERPFWSEFPEYDMQPVPMDQVLALNGAKSLLDLL